MEDMDLLLEHDLLKTAEEQPYGFLRVRGDELAHEVELLGHAHLVECYTGTADDGEQWAVIKSVTESGRRFLRSLGAAKVPLRRA
jgi:hypothetical protein